jgi:hypothetical protein
MTEQPRVQSEVARLRQQIGQETQAMRQGLSGLATVAAHAIIERRYEAIGKAHDQLAQLIGEQPAMELVIDAYNKALEGGQA